MFSDDIKEELIAGLIDIMINKLDKIILYGSIARGDSTKESDVDIALILHADLEEDEKNRFIHWNAEMDLKYGMVFSIVDIEKDNLEKWGNVLPFYKNIQDEGIVLWKAA
ncbi:MAG: nucleotidyltransferase domain-containing protein [Lachnospiraceae bacterium]|jgi:predicted nucleotidyltransferase|nr:nucleotidyltransferase domain-containing protein [Lachnospiraceae bacterium]